ncbi:MAG TPA: TonB-dependent receptor [Blastocatellia bacterium]|nr:TonB-dependent receptor [Blastocatellia bacterium]
MAQTTGSLSGRITDSQGAAVAGAKLTVLSKAGDPATSLSVVSEADGSYSFSVLRSGDYRLTVEKPGFQTLTRQLNLKEPALSETVDLVLAVNEVNETVNIVADAGVLTASKLDVPLRELPISLNQIGRYLSSVFTSNENDIRLGGYATWDATAFYRRERWEFNVNFYNALNKERYFVGSIYRSQLYPGKPFNWLMTLRFRSK